MTYSFPHRSSDPALRHGGKRLFLGAALALSAAMAPIRAHAEGLPAVQESQGVPYVSGGVTLDESTALKAAMPGYPLVVEVYRQAGGKNEYTASSVLTIDTPHGGQVFNATLQGPFALIRIAPGRYGLKVELNGQVKQSQVDVKAGGSARAVFVFQP